MEPQRNNKRITSRHLDRGYFLEDLFTALALVFVIEGVLYALFPTKMRQLIVKMVDVPDKSLRNSGLIATAIGVALVWLIRG